MSDFDQTITYLIDSIEVTAYDCSNMEKEAIAPAVIAAGRALLPAAKTLVRPLMNSITRIPGTQAAGQALTRGATGQLAKAKQWGSAIAADWTASGAAGKGLMASTTSALQTGMKVNPTLTTGAIAAPSFAMGGSGKKSKNKEIMQPGTIMIQSNENEAGINKQALMENQDPLDLMVKGIISGVTIGAGLALNSKFKSAKKVTSLNLRETEGLRGVGDIGATLLNQLDQDIIKLNKAPTASINDPRLRKVFNQNLEDVITVIKEVGKRARITGNTAESKSKLKEAVGTYGMPQDIKNRLLEEINRM